MSQYRSRAVFDAFQLTAERMHQQSTWPTWLVDQLTQPCYGSMGLKYDQRDPNRLLLTVAHNRFRYVVNINHWVVRDADRRVDAYTAEDFDKLFEPCNV